MSASREVDSAFSGCTFDYPAPWQGRHPVHVYVPEHLASFAHPAVSTIGLAGIMAAMRRTETDEIAGELYLVPPAGFVAARNELVRQSHAAGNRELADELRSLRRPTLSAWLVNLLARHERAPMERLLAVGREMRDAQTRLDTAQLRRLAGQREQMIADLLDRGRRRAVEAGMQPSEAVLSEVEATLKAALVDLAASSTVLSGRLVRPMSHSGFGPMPHVAAAPAMPEPSSPAEAPAQAARERSFPADELARKRARASADQGDSQQPQSAPSRPLDEEPWPAVTDEEPWFAATDEEPWFAATDEEQGVLRAAAELAAAESEHWQREFELADAEGAVDAARDRSEWLDSQRIQARRDRVTAERHLAEAQSAQQSAVRAVEDARRALEAAERRLRSTGEPPSDGTES
jgi:hypothetical protein